MWGKWLHSVRNCLGHGNAGTSAKHWQKTGQRVFEEVEPRVLLDAGLTAALAGVFEDLSSNVALAAKAGNEVSAKASKPPAPPPGPPAGYHTYASLESEMSALATTYGDICNLVDIGAADDPGEQSIVTVGGRHLWAMKISDAPDLDEAGEPEVLYIGTMHGNELVGMEMCIRFINQLLYDYNNPSNTAAYDRARDLVDNTEIWIMPLMNPDGLMAGTRANGAGVDLNRSFPNLSADATQSINVLTQPYSDIYFQSLATARKGAAPETAAVMRWSQEQDFVLAANFHTGALVVNYPYDSMAGVKNGKPAICPDDELFKYISVEYSSHNAPMYSSTTFPQGITNGCDWYQAVGSMQDWAYRFGGTNEVTIELSVADAPAASTLTQLFANNYGSMLSYLETVDMGIRGFVTDGTNPLAASIQITNTVTGQVNSHLVFTDADHGDYYRMALPGTYNVTVAAAGYQTQTFTVQVADQQFATHNFVLIPIATATGALTAASPAVAAYDAFYAALAQATAQESTKQTWDLVGDGSDATYSLPGKKLTTRAVEPARVAGWTQPQKSNA